MHHRTKRDTPYTPHRPPSATGYFPASQDSTLWRHSISAMLAVTSLIEYDKSDIRLTQTVPHAQDKPLFQV